MILRSTETAALSLGTWCDILMAIPAELTNGTAIRGRTDEVASGLGLVSRTASTEDGRAAASELAEQIGREITAADVDMPYIRIGPTKEETPGRPEQATATTARASTA